MPADTSSKYRTNGSALQSQQQSQEDSDTSSKESVSNWIILAVLCGLGLAVGLPSLSGQFLADDFTWLNLLCSRPQEILLSGFHGRYMYYPIFGEHYRPLLTIPFLIDALLFRTNAALLHLSNLLWHVGCTALVFSVGKRLCQSFAAPDSVRIAFWAAAIFAVHPFHCENIGWWTAKNDIVYSFFYLLSIDRFLCQSNRTGIWSYGAFLLALGCKETALTLPFLLCTHTFLKLASNEYKTWKHFFSFQSIEKWKRSFAETRVFFFILAGFWILRTVCLGQLGGSYYGSLTNLWFENFNDRFGNFTKDSTLWYPVDFNDGSFSQIMLNAFAVAYLLSTACVVHCWLKDRRQDCTEKRSSNSNSFSALVLFNGAFAALTLAPACLIWSPNNSLEGARLLYLFCVPLSFTYSILLNGPLMRTTSQTVRTTLLSTFVVLLSLSSFQTHSRWAFASNYCTALTQRIDSEARKLSDDQKLVLVDIPRVIRGVSIIHHFSILQDSLRPPFFDGQNARKVAGFEPHFFTEHDRINKDRLNSINGVGTRTELLYVLPNEKLDKGDLTQLPRANDIEIVRLALGHRQYATQVRSQNFRALTGKRETINGVPRREFPILLDKAIDGAEHGVMRLHLNSVGNSERLKFTIYWKSAEAKEFDKAHSKFYHEPYEQNDTDHGSKTITVNLGTTVTWTKEQKIDALLIMLMNEGPALESIDLLRTDDLLPTLELSDSVEPGADGVYRSESGTFTFKFDASSIHNCSAVRVEVCPALMDFMDINRKQLDLAICRKSVRSFTVQGNKSSFSIDDRLGSPVWHQIRIRPLTDHGEPIGYASEPLYIQSKSSKSLPDNVGGRE